MSHTYDIEKNIDIFNKVYVPKNNFYCHNCNKHGHTYKNCKEPKISNGVIAFNIKNFKSNVIPILDKFIKKNINKIFEKINSCFNNTITLQKFIKNSIEPNKISFDVKFLMVQRKHSLGFLEFVRGKYSLSNIETVANLIEQMIPEELDKIINNDFDYLWDYVWNTPDSKINNNKNNFYRKEYILSKSKFYQLKVNHKNIFNQFTPKFSFNEWGFPKGRREDYEHDLICAIREFEEETMFCDDNYTILEKSNSIRENLKGTNGVNYIHNYFFAIMHNDNNNNEINKDNNEISSMEFMDIINCIDSIRPYHYNKLKIIFSLYLTINKFLTDYEIGL